MKVVEEYRKAGDTDARPQNLTDESCPNPTHGKVVYATVVDVERAKWQDESWLLATATTGKVVFGGGSHTELALAPWLITSSKQLSKL